MPAHPRGAETRKGGRGSVAAVAVAGAIACVGARSTSRVATPAPPPIALPGVTAQLLPALGDDRDLQIVERDGAVQRVLAGALRAEVGPAGVRLADERFATPILAATRTPSGWLFFSSDLVVARADSFLGALQPLGALPRRFLDSWARQETVPTPSCGRFAFTTDDPDASLWITDGVAPLAPVRAFAPRVVISAAFADASHGLAVIEGGELFATRDGGAAFSRIALGTAAASSVACQDGALRVTTSTGVLGFDRELRPVPAPPAAPEQWPDAALYTAVVRAATAHYGALLERMSSSEISDRRWGTSERNAIWRPSGDHRARVAFATENGVATANAQPRLVRVVVADGSTRVTPLPAGVIAVGFATPDRGVAAGHAFTPLWLTQDGGASWRPTEVAMTGLLDPPPDYAAGVVCDAASCRVYDAVELRFGGASPPGDRVLATTIPRAPVPDHVDDSSPPDACTFTGPAGPSAAGHPPDTTIEGDPDMRRWRSRQRVDSAEIDQRRTRDGRWRISWHGRDAQGDYGERVVSAAWPWSGPDARTEPPRPARVTREGVLVQGDDLVWIPAGGAPVHLHDDRDAVVENALVDALVLPGGTLGVLMWRSPPMPSSVPTMPPVWDVLWQPYARERARLVIFDARGHALARRDLQTDAGRSAACMLGIAVVAGVPGIGWTSCAGVSRSRWFLPITPDSAASPLALSSVPPACDRRARTSDRVSSLLLDVPLYDATPSWVSRLRRVYVREGAAPCTQAVEIVFWGPNGEPPTAREVFAVADHRRLRLGSNEVHCPAP
jgi:hypothetical protein